MIAGIGSVIISVIVGAILVIVVLGILISKGIYRKR